MGVGFSHGGAHWSYSGFYNFRNKIAKVALDIPKLNDMEFCGLGSHWGLESKNISWDPYLKNPICKFFLHSDCEGEWTVEEMEGFLPELTKALYALPEDDWDRAEGFKLVAGMEEAVESGVPIELC
jgi:hypothetical protein